MCSRARAGILMVAAALLAPSAPLAARQTEQELIEHLREVTSQIPEAEQAAAEAKALRDARAALTGIEHIDTLRVGPMTILTPTDQRAMAEALYREVWEESYAPFVTTSPIFERQTLTFQWATTLGWIPVQGDVRRVEMLRWRGTDAAREGVRNAIAGMLTEDLPPKVKAWAQSPVREPKRPAELYRMFALASSKATRACLTGNADACWAALDVDPDDTPWDELYTPDERRALVLRYNFYARRAATEVQDCAAGRTPACDQALATVGDWRPFGTSNAPEGSLLWVALREGGPGAWDRLQEDRDRAPDEALRYVSGLDRDALVDRWHTWLVGHRPAERAGVDGHYFFYLMWIAAFAAFAMRSKRCRLG